MPRSGAGARRLIDAAAPAGRVLPWVLVAALGLVLVLRASGIVAAVHDNADTAAPLAMAELLDRFPHAAALTGNYGWWNGLWVVQLLRHLPGGTALASGVPIAAMVLCIAGLTWQAARLFGIRAAVAVPLVGAAIGADTWVLDGAWSGRGPSWWAMVAVGLVLVGRATRPAGARTGRIVRVRDGALLVVAVLWSAAALSGDALQWTSVVAPAAGVAAAMVATRRPRRAVVPLAAAAAIALLSRLVRDGAVDHGYFQRPSPLNLVPFDQAQGGAGNLVVALQLVWRGPVGSAAGAASGYLGLLVAVIAVAAGVTALVVALSDAWGTAGRSGDGGVAGPDRSEAEAGGAADDLRGAAPAGDAEDLAAARTAWVAFWTAAILATAVAFVFSSSSSVGGQPVARYLYGVPLAAGALLAALASRPTARRPVLVVAGVLAALAVLGMARVAPARTAAARPEAQAALIALAKAERVTRGYASYWPSYPLTLASHYGLEIAPVAECSGPTGVTVCPMYLHYVDRAYEPRDGVRSFLVVDAAPGSSGHGTWVTQAPAGITPVATHVVAPGIRMLVYDHDIAADMPPRNVLGEAIFHRR